MPKISALPPMTAAAADDEAPIVDDSASSTKKFTLTVLKEWLQSLTGWITTAMLANSSVTAAKLATPPARYVALASPIEVVNTDPANTNWNSVDLTASTSASAYAAEIHVHVLSATTAGRSAFVRKTGTSDTQSTANNVVNGQVVSQVGRAGTIVALDSSQSFDWSVSNADVSVLIIVLWGYWETVA